MDIKGWKRQFIRKVRRRESPFYKRLYDINFFIRRTKIPYIPPLGAFLWYLRLILRTVWGFLKENFYSQQITRYRCKVGKNLWIPGRAPFFKGSGKIIIGDNVRMWGAVDFSVGGNVYQDPTLIIGNNVNIGHLVGFSVKQKVVIGNNSGIGGGTKIFDNPHHPAEIDDPSERYIVPIEKEDCAPVIVEDDVWISERCVILKGVTIGKGAIVGVSSTVVKDVPPYTLVAGRPAKVIKKIRRPDEIKSENLKKGE